MLKFFLDFLSYQFSHLLGGRKYNDWDKEAHTLYLNIPIKNKNLAEELEDACQKNSLSANRRSFLTYAEFLTIDQFGKNGYHSTHKEHGMTDVIYRWPEALLALCKKKNFHHIVEFGPGNGKVGIKTLEYAKKEKYPLFWSGVEISEELKDYTKNLFHKKRLNSSLVELVDNINDLHLKEKCLFVFSYSLDNLNPEVFINTSQKQGPPDTMMGIIVKSGLLSEIILSNKDLQKIGCSLKNGIFKDSSGSSWDLNSWQLHPMQRLYFPLNVYQTIIKAVNVMPINSQILIIDEFSEPTHQQTYHIGIPRDLETFSRDFTDFKKFYKTAGSNLLYFPLFLDSLTSFISKLGFSLEENMGEHKMASELSEKRILLPKHPRTFALLALLKKTTGKKEFLF